jgi:MFS family permease
VLRRNWREVLLSTLAIQPVLVSFYLYATFALSYGTRTLKLSQGFMLVATLSAAAVALPAVITFGTLSDRFGYKRMYVYGLLAYGLLAFPYFWLFDTRNPVLVVVACVAGLVTFALLYGPLPALVSGLYSGQVRYTGVSLSYHLAAAIGGGPAPLLAAALLAATGSSLAIGAYVFLSALIALGAAALLRDRSALDHRIDYAQQTAAVAAVARPVRAPAGRPVRMPAVRPNGHRSVPAASRAEMLAAVRYRPGAGPPGGTNGLPPGAVALDDAELRAWREAHSSPTTPLPPDAQEPVRDG